MTFENSSFNATEFVKNVLGSNLTKVQTESPADLSKWFTTLIYTAYTVTFLIGFTGNVLVCLVINRKLNKRGIHLLTLNLAVSDLIVLLVYLPMEAYQLYTKWQWGLGTVMCRILYPVNSCTVNASIYTLVVITRDRYIAVKRPITARKRKTSSIKRWIFGIWAFSFSLSIPLVFVVDASMIFCTEHWPNIISSRIYWFTIFAIQFVLPLVFIVLSYILIIFHIQLQNLSFSDASNTFHSTVTENGKFRVRLLSDVIAVYTNTELKALRREQKSRINCMDNVRRKKQLNKMLKMIVVLVIVYFICVLPQHTVFFATLFTGITQNEYISYIFVIANYFLIANSSINPVIYGTLNDEIKKGIKKILLCRTASKHSSINNLLLPMDKSFLPRCFSFQSKVSSKTIPKQSEGRTSSF